MQIAKDAEKRINIRKFLIFSVGSMFTIITGLLYLLFQTIETNTRWIAVFLAILTISIAIYSYHHIFPQLRNYFTIILAFMAGIIIFALFLEEDFISNPLNELNRILLESTLASFQIDLTTIITIVFLQFLYLILLVIGLLGIFIPFIIYKRSQNSQIFKKRYKRVTLGAIFLLGIVITFFSLLLLILTGEIGLQFIIVENSFFQTRLQFYLILGFLLIGFILGLLIFITSDKYQFQQRFKIISGSLAGLSLILLVILFSAGVILGLGPGFENGRLLIVLFPATSATPIVSINEACSGIHSFMIFLFCFYAAILYTGRSMDWKKVSLAMIVGTIGTLSSNWIRIIIILLAGLFDAELIWQVHNYAGLVIFFSWMLLFWVIAVEYLIEKPQTIAS